MHDTAVPRPPPRSVLSNPSLHRTTLFPNARLHNNTQSKSDSSHYLFHRHSVSLRARSRPRSLRDAWVLLQCCNPRHPPHAPLPLARSLLSSLKSQPQCENDPQKGFKTRPPSSSHLRPSPSPPPNHCNLSQPPHRHSRLHYLRPSARPVGRPLLLPLLPTSHLLFRLLGLRRALLPLFLP
jgi:hypothetical protein